VCVPTGCVSCARQVCDQMPGCLAHDGMASTGGDCARHGRGRQRQGRGKAEAVLRTVTGVTAARVGGELGWARPRPRRGLWLATMRAETSSAGAKRAHKFGMAGTRCGCGTVPTDAEQGSAAAWPKGVGLGRRVRWTRKIGSSTNTFVARKTKRKLTSRHRLTSFLHGAVAS
jgi:hypothetical protein